ncbi:hypothetical protein GJ496_004926 [Pomphorhynchus laevis]|nr:hypothetical protein GJ496_004926 [Pomphorhynchus laevis]
MCLVGGYDYILTLLGFGLLVAQKIMKIRLSDMIQSFDGSSRQDWSEWIKKIELVCNLQTIRNLEHVIPLFEIVIGNASCILEAAADRGWTLLSVL